MIAFTTKMFGDHDVAIVKIDLNGSLIWNKVIGNSQYLDRARMIKALAGGGYAICGSTGSFGNHS